MRSRLHTLSRHLCAAAFTASCAVAGTAENQPTPLSVHFDDTTTQQWPAFVVEAIKTLEKREDIAVSLGDSKHLESAVDVLIVGGKGMGAEVLQAARPDSIVLPHAGIPPSFKTVLAAPEFEKIRLFTLHHNAHATAEIAIALLLATSRRVVLADKLLREGEWVARGAKAAPKSAHELGGTLLSDRATVVVVGFGEIGQRVASVCGALGMEVQAVRRSAQQPYVIEQTSSGGGRVEVFPNSSLESLLPFANAVVVALPLTPETHGMFNSRELSLLPEGCVLVNVGRAEVVDEQALWEALQRPCEGEGEGGGKRPRLSFGSDVWWHEPSAATAGKSGAGSDQPFWPSTQYPFHELDNVVMTPHYAGGKGMNGMEQDRVNTLVRVLEGMIKEKDPSSSSSMSGNHKGRVSDVQAGY